MTYLFSGLGIVVLALTVLLHLANGKIDDLNKELGASRANTTTAVHANTIMLQTLDLCEEINGQNADQRDSAQRRAELAEARIGVMAKILQESIDDFDTTEFRDNTECRTLSEPLPSNFVNSLCVNSAGNCSQ